MLKNLILVNVGAMSGACLRWALSAWLNKMLPNLALGTLLVNWLGCILMGVAIAKCDSGSLKLLFIIGFLGSFTTFSSFVIEIVQYLNHERWLTALNVLIWHIVGGVLACGGTLLFIRKFL